MGCVEISTPEWPATAEWLRLKRVYEAVRLAVVADMVKAVEIGEPELTVLVHLSQAGGASRQNALAASTGWDRTRLSHLLTRMESHHYLARSRLRNGVEVSLLPAGKALIDAAQPALEATVHRHLWARLDDHDRETLRRLLDALLS